MSTFKKNLIADCLVDANSFDNPKQSQATESVITCAGFESRINDLLDDRMDLSTDDAIQAHANECSGCQQTLQQYEQLTLVLDSARVDVKDAMVDRSSGASLGRARKRPSRHWLQMMVVAPLAVIALLVCSGQFFNNQKSFERGRSVAITSSNSVSSDLTGVPEIESSETALASLVEMPQIEPVSWTSQHSVRRLRGLVDSGSVLLAAGREQAAVLEGLSAVRLDLDLNELESRLVALQPVLSYSGRIPALSPMQGTVCFTLGWLRKGKSAEPSKLNSTSDAEAELGMHSFALQNLA